MSLVDTIAEKLFNQVRVNEIDRVEYRGPKRKNLTPRKWYTCVGYSVDSEGTWYNVKGDNGEYTYFKHWFLGEVKHRKVWTSADSLAGILSKVTYDEKWLKLWKMKND
jgi:hypothetical protein